MKFFIVLMIVLMLAFTLSGCGALTQVGKICIESPEFCR